MSDASQSYESHAKMVPGFHYWAFGLVLVPTVFFLYRLVTSASVDAAMTALLGVGVLFVGFYARFFALGVQDRVIRLEERQRLRQVLPDDLAGQVDQIRTDHLIGLRFAPDEELESLVRQVLAGDLADRKSIKQAIRNWRADHQRV